MFPNDEREVIVELLDGTITTGHYFKNGNVWRVRGEYIDIFAWQDLPKSAQHRVRLTKSRWAQFLDKLLAAFRR